MRQRWALGAMIVLLAGAVAVREVGDEGGGGGIAEQTERFVGGPFAAGNGSAAAGRLQGLSDFKGVLRVFRRSPRPLRTSLPTAGGISALLSPKQAARRMLGIPDANSYGELALDDLRGAVVDATCDWLREYYDTGQQPSDRYFVEGLTYYLSELDSPAENQVSAIKERLDTLKLALSGWQGAWQAGRELTCYFAGG